MQKRIKANQAAGTTETRGRRGTGPTPASDSRLGFRRAARHNSRPQQLPAIAAQRAGPADGRSAHRPPATQRPPSRGHTLVAVDTRVAKPPPSFKEKTTSARLPRLIGAASFLLCRQRHGKCVRAADGGAADSQAPLRRFHVVSGGAEGCTGTSPAPNCRLDL